VNIFASGMLVPHHVAQQLEEVVHLGEGDETHQQHQEVEQERGEDVGVHDLGQQAHPQLDPAAVGLGARAEAGLGADGEFSQPRDRGRQQVAPRAGPLQARQQQQSGDGEGRVGRPYRQFHRHGALLGQPDQADERQVIAEEGQEHAPHVARGLAALP
jgi:hypothetical protein